jgi:hypothetical protein
LLFQTLLLVLLQAQQQMPGLQMPHQVLHMNVAPLQWHLLGWVKIVQTLRYPQWHRSGLQESPQTRAKQPGLPQKLPGLLKTCLLSE